MTHSRLTGLLVPALLLGGATITVLPSFKPEFETLTPWVTAGLGLVALAILTAFRQQLGRAMPWMRGLIPQNEGRFVSPPPARQVTIRIVCHR